MAIIRRKFLKGMGGLAVAAAWAASRASAEDITEIRAACEAMSAEIDQPEQFVSIQSRRG